MINEIENVGDVRTFFNQLFEEGTNAHPDDDFNYYVSVGSGEATYTREEAEKRNYLMGVSFKICEGSQVDIYDLMQEIYLKATGLDKFIPLPSSDSEEQ